MQPMLPAHPQLPPPPPLPARRNTPFWHCAAGAGVWYVAAVVGMAAYKLKRQEPVEASLLGPLVVFGLVWLLTTAALWVILRLGNVRVKPWLLVIIAIPIGFAMMEAVTFAGLAALFAFMPR